MPAIYRIRLTATAGKHLQDIYDPLVEEHATFSVDVRSMPVRPFKVRYHVDDGTMSVTILSIQHGAREEG